MKKFLYIITLSSLALSSSLISNSILITTSVNSNKNNLINDSPRQITLQVNTPYAITYSSGNFIYYLDFSTPYSPSDFNFIKFYSTNGDDLASTYSWGNEGYYSDSINNKINNNQLTPYLINKKIDDSHLFDFSNDPHVVIAKDRQTWGSAVLRINIYVGFSFYWEKGDWFLQMHINHYRDTWGSSIGGQIKTPIGDHIVLSKIPFSD